jgi:hypothetical protein
MKEITTEKKAPRYGSRAYYKQHLLDNIEDAIEGTREGKALTAAQVQSLLNGNKQALGNALEYIKKAKTPAELAKALSWADAWHMADLYLRGMVRTGESIGGY